MSPDRTKSLRTRKPIARLVRRGAKKRARTGWRKWLRRLFIATLVLGGSGLLGVVGLFWYYGRDLPDVASLRDYQPPQTTRIVDRNGELLGEVFSERRTVVPMDRIPRHLVLCVLAAEDADFYRHEGLDYPGIVRALLRDVKEGRAAQGASTITQQVVKLLLLSSERTLERKVRELILARRLEQELTKDEILHLYLNHINFGHGRYGVQEAARFYFGKDVEDLTLAESSLIAGVPQAPARLSPRSHPEAAQRRQAYVLRQLEDKRDPYWPDLTVEAIQEARDAEPRVIDRPTREREGIEVVTLARQMLRELVGEEAFRRGGYTVHTTLDLDQQRAARRALQGGLEALDRRHGYRGPLRRPRRARDLEPIERLRTGRTYRAEAVGADDELGHVVFDVGGHRVLVDLSSAERYNPEGLSASAFAPVGARARVSIVELAREEEGEEARPARGRLELGPQAAMVMIEPRTRDVLAIVGGYEASPGFDRALQAVRQPGSTMKPLVYGLGLREGALTPASVMVDAPAVYDQWQPQNYETWRHQGAVRLRVALAKSINVVAVRAIEDLGAPQVAAFGRELGIESELEPNLSLALGASGVRPIEMVNAYASFAAGGRWLAPRFVARIEGPDGDVPLPERAAPRDVMTPAQAYVLTDMLTSVTREGGTAARASRLRVPVAGKTGTSNEARDAWFVGYTPGVVAGVWVGFDDRRSLGRRESGGRSALPIWIEAVRSASAADEFAEPTGVVRVEIDPASGLLPYEGQEDAIEEVFVEGTEPTERARPPDVADANTFLMEQFGGSAPPPPVPTPETQAP